MIDLISRQAAIDALVTAFVFHSYAGEAAKKIIEALPSAERVGHWDDDAVAFYRKCSECGCCVEWNKKPFLFGVGEYNYCPNCGAKMEVEHD